MLLIQASSCQFQWSEPGRCDFSNHLCRGVSHRKSLSGDFRERGVVRDLHHLPSVTELQPWWASVLPPVPTWGGYSWQLALLTWQPSRKATIWLPAKVTFLFSFFSLPFSEVGPSQEEGSLALWALGAFPDTLAARAAEPFASGLLISHSKRSSVLFPTDRQGFIFNKQLKTQWLCYMLHRVPLCR